MAVSFGLGYYLAKGQVVVKFVASKRKQEEVLGVMRQELAEKIEEINKALDEFNTL